MTAIINAIVLNQTFHYTRCITTKRVMSLLGPSPSNCTCGQHCSFRNVAAVAGHWQHYVDLTGRDLNLKKVKNLYP